MMITYPLVAISSRLQVQKSNSLRKDEHYKVLWFAIMRTFLGAHMSILDRILWMPLSRSSIEKGQKGCTRM